MTPADLYGRRADHDTLKTWLADPQGLLIVSGPSGCGKTTAIHTFTEDAGYDLIEGDDLSTTIDRSRHPSFTGRRRIALFDGVTQTWSKRDWSALTTLLKNHSPPCMVATHDIDSVPYNLRRSSTVHTMRQPEPRHILSLLRDFDHTLGLGASETILARISETATSWRSALLVLQSLPSDFDWTGEVDANVLPTSQQPTAVLAGTYRTQSTCHPLAILNMAQHNGANPEFVQQANMAHSRAWLTDDLSRVARMLVDTLRTKTQSKPPWRRGLKDSRRLKG